MELYRPDIQTTSRTTTGVGVGAKAGAGLIASGVISGLSDLATSFINAKRTKNAYDFNARMAELQGRMAKISAKAEINNIRRKGRELLSSQRAAYAKSGLALEGSPIDVMTKSQEDAELDAIYANINMEYGQSLYKTQADILRSQGKSSMENAYAGAAKTILSTASEVNKQYQLSKIYGG